MIKLKELALRIPDRAGLLTGGAVLLCLLLVVALVVANSRGDTLDRAIAARTQALSALVALREEAQLLLAQIRRAEEKLARTTPGTAAPRLEGLANRIAGAGNLSYLRPLATATVAELQVETLELKLERQTLEQLLRLLWELENDPAAPLRVVSLRLQRRFDNHALLDVTLTLNAYRK